MQQQQQITQSKITEFIGIKYEPDKDAIWLGETQDILRNTIGILGILLPPLIYLGLWIDSGHNQPLESISHYYLTRAGSVFVIIVSLLAFFLLIYKGSREIDFWISTLAGLSALMVILFPTGNISLKECELSHPVIMSHVKHNQFRETFHLISAAVFLGCLAFMSFFLFPHPKNSERIHKKKLRNRIYKFCAAFMVIFLGVMLVCFVTKQTNEEWYFNGKITFWMESLAVWSFGISWLVKGSIVKPITG
jgi:hypothetical protein